MCLIEMSTGKVIEVPFTASEVLKEVDRGLTTIAYSDGDELVHLFAAHIVAVREA